MPHVICLDLDGTLTDPKPGITRSICYAMERLGRSPPAEDLLEWCIGPPLLESLRTLLGTDADAKTALRFYRERFADVGLYENKLYPGVSEALAELSANGHRLIVATSKPTVYAARIVAHFGLTQHFEAVCGSELDGTRTDKSQLLAWIIETLGLIKSDTVMVGDRRHDIVGARNNGLAAIGVLYGYGSRAELEEAGALRLLAQPCELIDLAS